MADKGTELVAYDPELFPALTEQDPVEAERRFVRRFAQAQTVDDLFDALSGNLSKNMVGRTVEIQSVEWVPFQSDRGTIPNAICTAADVDTGEILEFATTSVALTHFVRRAEIVGGLPFKARIAAVKTRGGNTALNFERP